MNSTYSGLNGKVCHRLTFTVIETNEACLPRCFSFQQITEVFYLCGCTQMAMEPGILEWTKTAHSKKHRFWSSQCSTLGVACNQAQMAVPSCLARHAPGLLLHLLMGEEPIWCTQESTSPVHGCLPDVSIWTSGTTPGTGQMAHLISAYIFF